MKNNLSAILVLCFFSAHAQVQKDSSDKPTHHGILIEFGAGPVFGSIADNITTNISNVYGARVEDQEIKFSGSGLALDFKMGGALKKNLFLTFNILYKTMNHYDIYNYDDKLELEHKYRLDETSCGVGLTFYSTPKDYFVSLMVGLGAFDIKSDIKIVEYGNGPPDTVALGSSKTGFSSQIKGGKHWWLSNTFGMSLGAAYGFTSVADSKRYDVATEIMNSSRISFYVSVDYH